jgi:16S rRNA (cytosine1402-N4)-methyltransferase
MTRPYHTPVLAAEVVRFLEPRPGQTIVDGTLGGGGHAVLLGERLQPDGRLIVIDQDPEALAAAQDRLSSLNLVIIPIRGNFRDLPAILDGCGVREMHGLLLDLGVSSHQFDAGERGFSFRSDHPLDMRMNPEGGETAADLLARLDEREITRILWEYGEERWAKRIAQFIVEGRAMAPVRSTKQLADLVSRAIPRKAHPPDTHPATRTYQSLRIAVNDELNALQEALDGGISRLAVGGRIAVISYHSLEDRIVKQTFAKMSGRCQCPPKLPICQCGATKTLEILTRKPVVATDHEVNENPRARSAKLRAARRV